jgi:polyhydroxybutyrate depolymerase
MKARLGLRLLAGLPLACAAPGVHAGEAAAPGCAAPLPAGLQQLPVSSGGLQRPMALYVPPTVRPDQPLALVFDLHGSGGTAEQQAHSSQLRAIAAAEGFLVANPEGSVSLGAAPSGHFWNIPGVPLVNGEQTPADASDDVQYIADAIDAVAAATCLDRQRVYVTGMSGGGRMTSWLACVLADRIAAFAPVAGLRAGLSGPGPDRAPAPEACRPGRSVPILTFHGTDDRTNPYEGDDTPRWGYSVPVAVRRWAEIDGCDAQPVLTQVSPHVVREAYGSCAEGAELEFYRTEAPAAEGGGHVWPGGASPGDGPGKATPAADMGREISASRIIWAFFSRHRLAARP